MRWDIREKRALSLLFRLMILIKFFKLEKGLPKLVSFKFSERKNLACNFPCAIGVFDVASINRFLNN